MNWIERMYEIKGKDLYSQNGEGFYLEYIFSVLLNYGAPDSIDIGGGDGFHLSNTKHISNFGGDQFVIDRENPNLPITLTLDNIKKLVHHTDLLSIDTDGNDYWFLDWILPNTTPTVVIAEFNPAFTDARTIKYNPDHVWAGDDYYGFSFEAGVKLAEKHGYKIIFNVANMNLIMVREDLIKVSIPPVTYQQSEFFEKSKRTDWVFV